MERLRTLAMCLVTVLVLALTPNVEKESPGNNPATVPGGQ